MLDRCTLDIVNKIRSNPLPWRGQFSPQLVEAFLDKYSLKGSFLVDPFVGSGTVLYEAGRSGVRAFGSDVNPAAVGLSSVYRLINRNETERYEIINSIEGLIQNILTSQSLLFCEDGSTNFCGREIVSLKDFSRCLLKDLILISFLIYSDYFKNYKNKKAIWNAWLRFKRLVHSLPYSEGYIDIGLFDARRLPLDDGEVDMVITSPPYINVLNYHQQYRTTTEALGWDLLKVAKSEIGANRKFRSNRFFTVIQYCYDMFGFFAEVLRICKNGSNMVLVIGKESMVKSTRFFNGEIILGISKLFPGVRIKLKQERSFTNRYGKSIYEDIYYFLLDGKSEIPPIDYVGSLAKQILTKSLGLAPAKEICSLRYAIEHIDEIKPSPILKGNGF